MCGRERKDYTTSSAVKNILQQWVYGGKSAIHQYWIGPLVVLEVETDNSTD